MMELHVQNIEFKKEKDGTHRASLELHTQNGVERINVHCDVTILSQTYYTNSSEQITDQLKCAFHVAGLFLEKVFPSTDFCFVIPSAGDAPELWVDESAYYSKNKPDENSFPECLQACVHATNEYMNGNGEKLKYGGTSSLTL